MRGSPGAKREAKGAEEGKAGREIKAGSGHSWRYPLRASRRSCSFLRQWAQSGRFQSLRAVSARGSGEHPRIITAPGPVMAPPDCAELSLSTPPRLCSGAAVLIHLLHAKEEIPPDQARFPRGVGMNQAGRAYRRCREKKPARAETASHLEAGGRTFRRYAVPHGDEDSGSLPERLAGTVTRNRASGRQGPEAALFKALTAAAGVTAQDKLYRFFLRGNPVFKLKFLHLPQYFRKNGAGRIPEFYEVPSAEKRRGLLFPPFRTLPSFP